MHKDASHSPNMEPRDTPGPDRPTQPTQPARPTKPPVLSKRSRKQWLIVAAVVLIVVLGAGITWALTSNQTPLSNQPTTDATQTPTTKSVQAPGLQLDPSKNYGDVYANGILPVGDGKYVTAGAKQGSIYTCSQYAKSLMNDQGGAQTRGPWFVNNNTAYDLSKKARVQGSVMWKASFSNTVSGGARTIVTNDLPTHATGIFPIVSADPVYAYDRNPNSIKGQALTYALNASPSYGSPSCMSGESGIMLTGIALFNAFDAGGHDAGAWEVQDACSGHPQRDGIYHYHTLSACIKDTSIHTVVGYALDGFPITGPKVGVKNVLTTRDLDECHGITSQVNVDGRSVTTYHYVMTQDFPYSVSCFRSAAIPAPDLQQYPQPAPKL
jgi:hypothetical protein